MNCLEHHDHVAMHNTADLAQSSLTHMPQPTAATMSKPGMLCLLHITTVALTIYNALAVSGVVDPHIKTAQRVSSPTRLQ